MATTAELRKEIGLLEKAIAVKGLNANIKTNLRKKLRAKKAELKSGGGKKSTAKGGVSSAKKLQDLLKTMKSANNNKRLAVYKKSGVDIPKDAARPALPRGQRISKNGKKYTENRPNHFDVKQPPKRYPKLANGGYMAGGGDIKYAKEKLANLAYQLQAADEGWIKNNHSEFVKMQNEYKKQWVKVHGNTKYADPNEFAKGGYMAKGGTLPNNYKGKSGEEVWDMWTFEQKWHFLEDHEDDITKGGYEPKKTWRSIANYDKWKDLSPVIKKELDRHVSAGQYSNGGKLKFTTMTEDSFLEKYGTATNVYPQSVRNTFDIISYGSPIKERREGFLSAMKMNGYKVKVDGEFAVAVKKRNIREHGGYMEEGGLMPNKNEPHRLEGGL